MQIAGHLLESEMARDKHLVELSVRGIPRAESVHEVHEEGGSGPVATRQLQESLVMMQSLLTDLHGRMASLETAKADSDLKLSRALAGSGSAPPIVGSLPGIGAPRLTPASAIFGLGSSSAQLQNDPKIPAFSNGMHPASPPMVGSGSGGPALLPVGGVSTTLSGSRLEAMVADRQLEKTMVAAGVEEPRAVLTKTLSKKISTSEGTVTIGPPREKEVGDWSELDFVRFCSDTRISLEQAGDHVNAAHWIRLQDSVFDFMVRNKYEWAQGGRIYLLHILNGLRKHEFTMEEFTSKYSVVALTLQQQVSNLYNRHPAQKKKGPNPDPYLSPEHIKKFLVWKAEADHATTCPGCSKKYQPKDCLSHYKHCADLEAVRAEHQE
jgi:hypothetical protein